MYLPKGYCLGKYTQTKTRLCTILPKVHLKQVCSHHKHFLFSVINCPTYPTYLTPPKLNLLTLLQTQKYFCTLNFVFFLQYLILEISTQYNRIIGCSDSSKSNEMSVMSLLNVLKGALDPMNAIVFVHKRSPNQAVKSHW